MACLAFAQHVNERQRNLRGLGAFRVNERVRYLRGLGQDDAPTVEQLMEVGVPREQAENMLINYWVPGSDLPIGWEPTTETPTGTQSKGAPVFSKQWMQSQMIPGVQNSYLVLAVAGVFFVSALKKKKR